MESHAHEHDDHDEQHIHPEPTSFIRKYIFSMDHKVIAKQFIWLGLSFLAGSCSTTEAFGARVPARNMRLAAVTN